MAVELVGKLRLDGAGWRDGLTKAKSDAKRFGAEVGGLVGVGIKTAVVGVLGYLGANAILSSLKGAIDRAGTLRDTSTNLRTTIEDYQAFTFALLQSGAKAEDAATVLTRLALSQEEAIGGNERYVAAFERLGVSVDSLKTGNIVELFARLADEVQKNGLNTKELADLYEILGKGAAKVTAVLRANFRDTFKQGLGVAISAEEVEKIAAVGDKLTTLGFQIKRFWSGVAGQFVDPLIYALEYLDKLMSRIGVGAKDGSLFSAIGGFIRPFSDKTELPLLLKEFSRKASEEASVSTKKILDDLQARAKARREDVNANVEFPGQENPDVPTRLGGQTRSDAATARGLFLDARRDSNIRQQFYVKFLREAERINGKLSIQNERLERVLNG